MKSNNPLLRAKNLLLTPHLGASTIEAKEGVPIQSENQTFASTTYQNYFRLYEKLSGMTGTAMTEAQEFFDIYKLDVVDIPTNVAVERKDLNDQIYRTEKEKVNAIIESIKAIKILLRCFFTYSWKSLFKINFSSSNFIFQ